MEIKDDLSYKVIGCAMKVHRTLGNGFQEVIYQRALEIEFLNNNIVFEREKEIKRLRHPKNKQNLNIHSSNESKF